jgi:hypothetical protein
MARDLLWIDATQLEMFAAAVASGYRPDTATPSQNGLTQYSRPEWCEGQNRAVADLSRDQRREHSRGACCPAEAPTEHAGMRELVQQALDSIHDLPLTAVIAHDWLWESDRAAAFDQHPDIADAAAYRRALTGTPEAVREWLRWVNRTDREWMRLARFAAEACRLILSSAVSIDPDGRRPPRLKPLRTAALAYFAELAQPRLAVERAAYLLRRAELDYQMAKIIEKVDRREGGELITTLIAAVDALPPLCATYLTLIEPPEATQWALDLAWRVGATEYDAELQPLSEQVNERALKDEVLRRLPLANLFELSPLDLSAALRAVGALDHADTATRYLGSLRVSEAAQPEREALRQQVAKFSA